MLHNPSIWQKFRTSMQGREHVLEELAQKARAHHRLTIVDKARLPESGDPHDYYSIGTYWWPDPNKPDGLPYIRRDGERNPETANYDRHTLDVFTGAALGLLLSAEVSGGTPDARLLHDWFLNPATCMNPHLSYAQAIPGICSGRGIGIIDTAPWCFLLDLVLHNPDLQKSEHLPGVRNWFAKYLDWLLDSDFGKKEEAEHNNHGTWYDAQVACFACFCDRPELARQQIEAKTLSRIPLHIAADGSQPHELARTLSYSYSTFNLLAFACLARIAARFSIDLWNTSVEGRTLSSAMDFLLPYYQGAKEWTWPQIKTPRQAPAAVLLSLAWQSLGSTEIWQTAETMAEHPWQWLCYSDLG